MKVGDVVWITAVNDPTKNGCGVYLGKARRRNNGRNLAFLWHGRVATFIPRYWKFEVLT